MAYDTVGINFSAISNLSPPDFNLTNITQQQFIDSLPENANYITYDYYGIIILTVLIIFLIWYLTDKTQYGYFQYNGTRALGIATGIASTMGIIGINVNWFTNYIHIGFIFGIYLLMLIYTYLNNPN